MTRPMKTTAPHIALLTLLCAMALLLGACAQSQAVGADKKDNSSNALAASDIAEPEQASSASEEPDDSSESSTSSASGNGDQADEGSSAADSAEEQQSGNTDDAADSAPNEADKTDGASAEAQRATLNISEDYRTSFVHGDKSAAFQKYIVLHDTEGDSDPSSVIDYWDGNGNLVAAHFVVGKDGSIVQCVPLDNIAHHAGFGDTGHDALYGVEDESRDDKLGTTPIGDWAADYGMNSYSVGIEMVHVGGSGDYPEEQLAAVDNLIAYIDAYYGFESAIIDHKAWRSGNSDTSPEFADYLANYQTTRKHTA